MVRKYALLAFAALPGCLGDKPASNACKKLKNEHPDKTYYGLDPRYINANTEYYSSSSWLGPACVFEPSNSTQMSDAVQALKAANSPFAIRGGGHMPIANAANINSSGVLLSSFGLNQLKLSDDHSTVNVGPGNRWSDIYKYLEPYGLTVVGGRLGHVGVPGYILGGGVSYLSNEYGWASANVASVTGVLADGKVVKATPENEYSDLFWALRGGSSSFALVTNFELKTIKAPTVMIGMASYGSDVAEQFIDAVHSFTTEGSKDAKAATIPMAEYIPALGKPAYSAILFYNGVDEKPAALKSFLESDMKVTSNTFSNRSMSKWCKELDPALSLLKGSKQRFYVLNIHASNKQAITIVHDTFMKVAKESLPLGVLVAALAFPAVTEKFITASTANGGDPQSLDVNGAPYIWVEESITSAGLVDDKDVDAFYEKANGQIVKNLQAAGIETAKFIYLNDANPSQDAFGTFPPENLERLKAIRAKYDPDRVFTDLMPGGWKLA
ncbi:putative FAD dependent oxidoreductase [Aspergillus avenaceus]|uniref:Putative FAD dependent oxidoreductase n=1 Tax=Aspergillus avenaceus TaxID=36643 RepID=A0A5N6TSK3_ASPAV|nr:putative FAD dependent oxidoreductase [Aspergillus avenaceus]